MQNSPVVLARNYHSVTTYGDVIATVIVNVHPVCQTNLEQCLISVPFSLQFIQLKVLISKCKHVKIAILQGIAQIIRPKLIPEFSTKCAYQILSFPWLSIVQLQLHPVWIWTESSVCFYHLHCIHHYCSLLLGRKTDAADNSLHL